MNQYFSPTRFGRLFRKHTTEHATSYLLSTAVLLGGMLAVMGFLTYLQNSPPSLIGQGVLCILFLLGAGSFFASSVVGQFGAGRRAALALTLPASQVEKYLVAWLFSLPIFLVVFVATFYTADWLIVHVGSQPQPLLNVFSEKALPVLLIYLVVHGVALWGSIFYQRLQFVKTAFVGLLVAVVVGFANYRSLKLLLGEELGSAIPLGDVHLQNGTLLNLPETQDHWLVVVPLALAALLWAAAYARLTEKQI